VVAALAAVIAVSGCAAESAQGTEVTVFAAASLTETFTQLGKDFEAASSGVRVKFNFGGSPALAQQINSGAPADVFASASTANMRQVGNATQPTTFARNRLSIAVGKGNPLKITSLADVTKPGVKLALCAEQVPCGVAAKKAFEVAKLTPKPVTLEQDVKATLTKIRLGEVDAALVYRTDVSAAGGDVEGVEFPESAQAINDYPIAALTRTPNVQAFVDYVLSAKGREVLAKAGFDAP
jgi:molybdate transport system substrate-binding protein